MNTQMAWATGLSSLVAAVSLSCQTYTFERVSPVAVAQTTQTTVVGATKPRPNIMVVVDQSRSMVKPIDPANPSCPIACGTLDNPSCPANCPTRISDLQDAMNAFFSSASNQTLGRFGLDRLPDTAFGDQCGVTALGGIDVNIPPPSLTDDPQQLQKSAQAVNAVIQTIQPTGGTPTAATLALLQGYAPLLDSNRDNYVLLLTDGEPNCNAQNTNSCATAACNCTLYAGVAPDAGICPGPSCECQLGATSCELGCLDEDATVAAIKGLRQRGVKTIPVGFGSETVVHGGGTGFAPIALNAMALAGGLPRSCKTDADCNDGADGGLLHDSCDIASGPLCPGNTYCCARKYFVALNSTELQVALAKIGQQLGGGCVYPLDAVPTDPSLLVVRLNGTDIPASGALAGTCADGNGPNWVYAPPASGAQATVTFQGSCCAALTHPPSPVTVELLVVQTL